MGGPGSGRYDLSRTSVTDLPKRMVVRRRHGWLDRLDGRSALGRALRTKRAALFSHMGGEPSVVEADLIDRYIHVDLLIAQFEDQFRRNDPGYDVQAHLSALDRFRRLADAIGPSRRARDTLDLRAYVDHMQGGSEKAQEPRSPGWGKAGEGLGGTGQ